jgi:hypothetical protein
MVQTQRDSCEEGTTTHFSPFRGLKRLDMGPQILKRFDSCTIKGILTGCITAWYDNCSSSDRKALCTAQYITWAKLPDIQDLWYILGGVTGRP